MQFYNSHHTPKEKIENQKVLCTQNLLKTTTKAAEKRHFSTMPESFGWLSQKKTATREMLLAWGFPRKKLLYNLQRMCLSGKFLKSYSSQSQATMLQVLTTHTSWEMYFSRAEFACEFMPWARCSCGPPVTTFFHDEFSKHDLLFVSVLCK